MRPLVPGFCLALFLSVPAAAQRTTGTVYRAPAEPQLSEARNVFRLYYLNGADTVGAWVTLHFGIEERWLEAGDSLRVVQSRTDFGDQVPRRVDTMTVLGSGRVVTVGGRPAGATEAPIDWYPRLPDPAIRLRPGVTWTDTIVRSGPDQVYSATRRYRVGRSLDTLGVRAIEVVGEGDLHFRMTSWTDSAAGTGRWYDLRGPVIDTFWFDPVAGRGLGRKWVMDLRGHSASLPARPGDTTAAGLPSRETIKLASRERTTLMHAPLPAGDTLITVRDADLILVYTVRRSGDSLSLGMRRMDAMYGVARVVFADGAVRSGEVTWVDSLDARRFAYRVDGKSLVEDDGRRLDLPTGRWAVADYGMDGLLAPALMGIPADGLSHPLAIYRPFRREWDQVTVVVRSVDAGRMARIRLASGVVVIVLLAPDGTWLLSVNEGTPNTVTGPRDGSPRGPMLEKLVSQLRGDRRS